MDPLFLLIIPIAQLILAAIVFSKNPRNRLNWSFALLMFGIAGWGISILLRPHTPEFMQLFSGRSTFALASIIPCSAFVFSLSVSKQKQLQFLAVPSLLLGLFFFLFSFTPAVIPEVEQVSWGLNPIQGWGLPILDGYIFVFLMLTIAVLIQGFRQSSGMDRYKIGYIILGVVLSSAIGIFSNIVWPSVTDQSTLSEVGPFGSIFLTAFSAYAILKYRFLDIRVVIRRSLMYGILFSVVAGLIAFFVILLARAVEDSFAIHAWAAAGVIAVLIALAFHPLKKIVQKLVELLVPPQPALSPLPEDAQELITKSGVLLRKVLKVDAIEVTPRHEMRAHGWSERCAQHFETLSVERRRALTLEQIPTLRTPELNTALNILEKCLVENDIVVAVPMLSRSRELLGVITLKPKPKNAAYTPEEIVYLEAFSGAISLRLEQILAEESPAIKVKSQYKTQ